MENKQTDIFGHKLEVLLDMIEDQVDNPRQAIKYKIKELFIRLFDMYLKKELGWRHTDDFKKVVNEL